MDNSSNFSIHTGFSLNSNDNIFNCHNYQMNENIILVL